MFSASPQTQCLPGSGSPGGGFGGQKHTPAFLPRTITSPSKPVSALPVAPFRRKRTGSARSFRLDVRSYCSSVNTHSSRLCPLGTFLGDCRLPGPRGLGEPDAARGQRVEGRMRCLGTCPAQSVGHPTVHEDTGGLLSPQTLFLSKSPKEDSTKHHKQRFHFLTL